MRAGYDHSQTVYDSVIKKNGTDFIRHHRRTDDSYLPRMQFTAYAKVAVPFQIYIEFQYRLPFKLDRLGASPVNFNRLYLSAVQNGEFLSGFNPLQLPIPSDGGWVTYSTTITTFASTVGAAFVSLSGRAMQQTVDFRYARAFVKTNNPNDVITLGNTFDVNKYHNVTGDVKNITPIATQANIIKGIKL